MRGCHRFRDTSALDLSPFTSLEDVNSATVQLPTSGSLRTDFVFPCSTNKTDHHIPAANKERTRPKRWGAVVSTSSHSRVDSSLSLSSQGELHFEPQATSTEYRGSHRIQSSQFKSSPWLGSSSYPEGSGETSPPPYSRSDSFATAQDTPVPSDPDRDFQELKDYSELDLENETLSSRYTQCVALSLEDYYHGKRITFGFTRKYISGKRKPSRESLTVIIPPGCHSDTVFCFSNVGHQLEDGSCQDIHLIFVERPHPLKFYRSGPNLSTSVCLPWSDHLNERPMRFSFTNVDGKRYTLEVDYRVNKMVTGSATFQDSGMPRLVGEGRGTLKVEWEIATPPACEPVS